MQVRITSRRAARKARRRGLFLPGPDDGEFGGDAAGGGKQDVPRAAGNIGDAQIEQRGFRIGGFEALGNQVVERVFDERLDEVVRGVVRAGRGAFPALLEGEFHVLPWL